MRPSGHRFRTIAPRNTTQAGYGHDHQQEAKRRRAVTQPTDHCGYCKRPLGPERLPGDTASRWHLPHNETRTAYLPGMWHAHCNRIEAAKRGNQRQRGRTPRRAQSRNWHGDIPPTSGQI